MYDILIVGGGTAGLTAAIYARRAGKTVLVIEGTGFGGQIASSPLVENYPGIPAVSGVDYSNALLKQAKDLGAETRFGTVSAARKEEDKFVLTVGKKEFEGKALILATGAKHRKLGVEGEDALVGRGISYCATCDGGFFKDRDTAVVGGGDSALISAIYLAGICKKVTVIHRRNEFRGQFAYIENLKARENVEFALESRVTALRSGETLTGVELTYNDGHTAELPVNGLFVEVGQVPDNGPFQELAEVDAAGYFTAGEDCLTSTPGVFVAGDCRAKELRQLTTAAADGSVAATAACQWLNSGK